MKTATLILNFGRCSWSQCMFCGYGREIGGAATPEKVDERLDAFLETLEDGVEHIKIFGSGSFLDDRQVPAESRSRFAEKIRENGVSLTFESRPEHVNQKTLSDFEGIDATVAFGLETSNEKLLSSINKGFTVEDYVKAAQAVREKGFSVRTYLLANIPGDEDMHENLARSVDTALSNGETAVIINLLPHGNTPLFRKWVDGEWTFLDEKEFGELTRPWRDDDRVELDFETFRFTPRFPKDMQKNLRGVGEEYLTHRFFEVWQDYLARFYSPRQGRPILFLPCSYTKPYSKSRTHQAIIKVLDEEGVRGKAHEVMLSNAGVIPREYEDRYPFNKYDWEEARETPAIKKRYVDVTAERISRYLNSHENAYTGIYCYLKYSSESYQALEKSCRQVNAEFKNLLNRETHEDNPGLKLYGEKALADLEENLKCLTQNSM